MRTRRQGCTAKSAPSLEWAFSSKLPPLSSGFSPDVATNFYRGSDLSARKRKFGCSAYLKRSSTAPHSNQSILVRLTDILFKSPLNFAQSRAIACRSRLQAFELSSLVPTALIATHKPKTLGRQGSPYPHKGLRLRTQNRRWHFLSAVHRSQR